jgi:putative ABC transport system permease protein
MSNVVPTVYVGFEDGRRLFGIRNPSVFTVAVREGRAPETVRGAIRDSLGSRMPLLISTLDEVKSEVRAGVAAGLNAFLVLVGLAGGLGLLGLANTMAVSMLERYREIGLLRAIGARKRQIRGMALVESATLVGVAFVLAVPMGILVSAPLVNFGARLVGDFTVHYVFPWATLPLLAVAGAAAAAVTAIGPARRATRVDIETALRFE